MTDYRYCKKCVLDSKDVPNLDLNDLGICQYCLDYENKFDKNPIDEKLKLKQLEENLKEIKLKGKKYDCILGLSGGVDSSYMAFLLKEWNVKTLLVHFDNGWNSELAVHNINNIVNYTGFDLHTYVSEWEEFKDLQLAYIKASVLDWEVPTDHIIKSTLYKIAKQKGIKSIVLGTNYQTEFILPKNMRFNKSDSVNIIDIHNKFGSKKIKTLEIMSPLKEWFYINFYKIKSYPIFNFIEYNKDIAKQTIIEKMGWRDYGGKHYESIFTRFYQGYALFKKFGIDKRKAHLSSLINNKQISRNEALKELESNPYPSTDLLNQDKEYVAKKLGLTNEEFELILNKKPVLHENFKQYDYSVLKKFNFLLVYINPSLYINYIKRKFKN